MARNRWGFSSSMEKMCEIPALSHFPPHCAHPRPNGPGFAFWLQESIKTAQKHSPFALQSKLLQSKLLYYTEGSGRWVCRMQIHRYNCWSLCWHQDALAVPFLTCLPHLSDLASVCPGGEKSRVCCVTQKRTTRSQAFRSAAKISNAF